MILVVTAVEAERDAVLRGVPAGAPVEVVAAGVGPASAGAGTAWHLGRRGGVFTAVLSAGIAGGFGGRIPLGALAVATRSVAADLGAESPEGFVPLDALGFGASTIAADPRLVAAVLAAAPDAVAGPVLTLATVTGTAGSAAELLRRHPDAVAEAMEGFGVATAAVQAGLPFGELRTISNPVGPRDRAAWRIGPALAALTAVFAALRWAP